MTALSFLGLGGKNGYQETKYVWNGAWSETHLFPHAVSELFDPDRLLVVMTQEVREKYHDELKGCCQFTPLAVPTGKNEAELWEMFDVIADAVPDETELLIDVTHGFRTQPLLVLAAGLYLRAARDVRIERIIYGAFEARNRDTNESPVLDLTSFLDLVDWSSAARMMFQYGNAAPLRDLLQEIHGGTYTADTGHQSQGLYHVGNALGRLTDALATIRPQEVIEQARDFPQQVERAEEDLEHLPQTGPFSLLLEKIESRAQPLAGDDLFSDAGFQAQAAMIAFYLETEQYPQAIALAREAVASKVCVQNERHPIKERDYIEKDVLNEEAHRLEKREPVKNEARAQLWGDLTEVRNDLLHAGMRLDPLSTPKIRERVGETAEEARKFILPS